MKKTTLCFVLTLIILAFMAGVSLGLVPYLKSTISKNKLRLFYYLTLSFYQRYARKQKHGESSKEYIFIFWILFFDKLIKIKIYFNRWQQLSKTWITATHIKFIRFRAEPTKLFAVRDKRKNGKRPTAKHQHQY